uniref:Uncharacterized protein n=1 Tax=Zea mays TaxID=4577 RepID=C4J1L0_MAIZE|nr:unknown [Zea mays]
MNVLASDCSIQGQVVSTEQLT